MNYEQLKAYMHKFRIGELTKYEMICAIQIWQRNLK